MLPLLKNEEASFIHLVRSAAGQALADEYALKYFECSAKTGAHCRAKAIPGPF